MLLPALLLLPLLAGLACAFIRAPRWLEWLNLAAFAGVAALAAAIARQALLYGHIQAWGGFLYADSLSALVIVLTAFVSLSTAVYAIGYFRTDRENHKATSAQIRRYYALTPLFVFAMLLVTVANNLGVMWVALEATGLACALLIAFYNEKTSLEAAWKYIMIGSIGIALALFGTILVYYSAIRVPGATEATAMNWSWLATRAAQFDPQAMRLGFIMVLLGYGTKAGLAPMHTWKPDAYSEAPIPAAALLSAGMLNCAIYGIARFHVLAVKCLGSDFPGGLLVFFGLASMLVATPFIVVQRNYRRLLAYSSIEHAGIMVAAIGFGGPLAMLGATLHMLFHAITKPLLFFCAGTVQQHFGTPFFRKVRGVIKVMPLTGAFLLAVTFAVTAVPPFGIFQSEFTILAGGLATNHALAVAIFLFCVVAIFAGFLQHMVNLVFGAPHDPAPATVSRWKNGAMLGSMAIIAVSGLFLPSSIYKLAQAAAEIIGGGL
jgi:hydrogenase-4 component F